MDNAKPALLSPRVEQFIARAKQRARVWREIDLALFEPDLQGQTLRVWVNAPSILREEVAALDEYSGEKFYALLAAYSEYSAEEVRDLFEAWTDGLRFYVVSQLFIKLREYRNEQMNFLISSRADGTANNSETSASPTA